ncbi:iron transporter [Marinitoga sp. 1135]|uniref:Ferrous iron transport protein B n=1 Tax=Marinitoga piezophila (strain DSM 14283 / JCM 11233 / KA3) TaxID=443254 RepID=H2J3J6_MARPK|nr:MULTISPECIES: ferrous iron transport protein B [Marinitoga]AEX84640.1 ferrous iron transporter FeoB [Marinitoga piezophila KA3]APT75157.1 iron transporter [Marinitoga sp. 1137]NUU94931.1 iron transporter [Marinitoga sp. 1135]NUU96884.1 iron transporter [Marinitoga sp. 1138]
MTFEIAIIGNPNVGKTSIFNIITGSRQYIANWPGVTVEKKVGSFKYMGHNFKLVDLPGIYTLSAQSDDEKVARDYLINESPDAVVVVADALNLERSMYLLTQILEMNLPVVLAINSIDEAEAKGKVINPSFISKTLNIPVILTSAKKNIGIDKLLEEIHKTAETKHVPAKNFLYTDKINEYINEFINEVKKYSMLNSYDSRWLAIYYLEFGNKNFHYPEELIEHINKKFDMNKLKSEFMNWKFKFISSLINSAVVEEGRSWAMRDILDHVMTHKVLGLLIYVIALYFVFSLTFNIASPLSDLIDMGFSALGNLIDGKIQIPWLNSLIVDGIIGGVGGVLVFIPQLFVLFFFMGFLEESGYLPRAAFLVDKLVRKFGLSGRSFMSIILGFGCSVPAIMSTKTIANKKERMALILSIPFASCSARLPVFILLISAFFDKNAAFILLSVYITSILLVLISAKILQIFFIRGEEVPFTIELPRFRMPTFRNLALYSWNRGKHFLEKAGGIILIATIFIWLLSYFPNNNDIANSYAAMLGKFFEPITMHLGWNWQTNISLLFGAVAKEVVASSYMTILNVGEDGISYALRTILTERSALALIFFVLTYIPCFATLSVIKQETNSWKWMFFELFYTLLVAYGLANLVYWIGGFIL